MVPEYVKAKWGKCYALPLMHQGQLGLLHDTSRKGTRQKTQQTAFGRLVAIKDVWWFRPEMGGLARVFNCGEIKLKNNFDRDDTHPVSLVRSI